MIYMFVCNDNGIGPRVITLPRLLFETKLTPPPSEPTYKSDADNNGYVRLLKKHGLHGSDNHPVQGCSPRNKGKCQLINTLLLHLKIRVVLRYSVRTHNIYTIHVLP